MEIIDTAIVIRESVGDSTSLCTNDDYDGSSRQRTRRRRRVEGISYSSVTKQLNLKLCCVRDVLDDVCGDEVMPFALERLRTSPSLFGHMEDILGDFKTLQKIENNDLRKGDCVTYIAVQIGASPMTEADICSVMDNCRFIQRQLYKVHQILRAMPLLAGMKQEEFQSSESDPHFLGNETSSCDLDRLEWEANANIVVCRRHLDDFIRAAAELDKKRDGTLQDSGIDLLFCNVPDTRAEALLSNVPGLREDIPFPASPFMPTQITDRNPKAHATNVLFHSLAPCLKSEEFDRLGPKVLSQWLSFGSQDKYCSVHGNFCMIFGLRNKPNLNGSIVARGDKLENGRWSVQPLAPLSLEFLTARVAQKPPDDLFQKALGISPTNLAYFNLGDIRWAFSDGLNV
jgi:hypothetical protein